MSSQRITALLQNDRNWKPTTALLKHACKIIEVCGGEPEDVVNWSEYHQQVATYAVTGQPLPTPPEPVRFAAATSAERVPGPELAIAHPTGDRPRRPRLRWTVRIAIWAVISGFLAVQRVDTRGLLLWQILVVTAFSLLAPLACVTVASFLMAVAGPRLDAVSRRHQERSFRANVPDTWPVYALYLLVLVAVWSGSPLFGTPALGIEVKILITGVVLIAIVRMVQLTVQKVTTLDTTWPPTITPDSLTFRRSTIRMRDLLTEDPHVNDTRRRQAEAVLDALAAVRDELTDRSRMTWRQWLAQGPTKDPLPPVSAGMLVSVALLVCAGLAIRPWADATARSVLLPLGVLAAATVLTAVALAVSLGAQRRHDRRLAQEIRARETELRSLVAPPLP